MEPGKLEIDARDASDTRPSARGGVSGRGRFVRPLDIAPADTPALIAYAWRLDWPYGHLAVAAHYRTHGAKPARRHGDAIDTQNKRRPRRLGAERANHAPQSAAELLRASSASSTKARHLK